MYKKEYKTITEKKTIIVAVICDACGKELNQHDYPDDWHDFSARHDDWDNDSIESYENYAACSPECYIKLLARAIDDFSKYNDVTIDDMTGEFAKRLSNYLNNENK